MTHSFNHLEELLSDIVKKEVIYGGVKNRVGRPRSVVIKPLAERKDIHGYKYFSLKKEYRNLKLSDNDRVGIIYQIEPHINRENFILTIDEENFNMIFSLVDNEEEHVIWHIGNHGNLSMQYYNLKNELKQFNGYPLDKKFEIGEINNKISNTFKAKGENDVIISASEILTSIKSRVGMRGNDDVHFSKAEQFYTISYMTLEEINNSTFTLTFRNLTETDVKMAHDMVRGILCPIVTTSSA